MLAAEARWTIHTDVFDGPLDLLLYLVKRDGIDLRAMSIAPVADSYLAYLEQMQSLNISVASDYLVMAASLCHLKSLELLPRPPSILEDEEEDPKEALARQLEAYEVYKAAAEALEELPVQDRDVFVREPVDVGDVDRPLIPGIDAFGLLDIYYKVLTRPIRQEVVHTIHKPEVDLGQCCRSILKGLGGIGGKGTLRPLLLGFKTKGERVIAFIGVLEMCRLGWIRLSQAGHLAPVDITSLVPADQPLDAIRGDVEEVAS